MNWVAGPAPELPGEEVRGLRCFLAMTLPSMQKKKEKKKEKDWGQVLESGLLLEHGGDVKRVCLS